MQVRLGHLQKIGSIYTQKSADILLAVDLVRLSTEARIGTACLVAGDSDFAPAVQVAKNAGVLIKLYFGGPRRKVRAELWDICDERIPMDQAFCESIELPRRLTP